MSARYRTSVYTLLATLLAFGPPASAQTAEHVFIVVIDGLRASEGFDDPEYELVAPLVEELAPQGSLLTYMEIRGQPLTLPAHQVFTTGTYADCGNTSAYEDRLFLAPRVPTLFDLYRRHTGADVDASWVISNTPLVGHDCEHTLMPGFGLERSAESVVDFTYTESDDWVWDQVDAALAGGEVDLMLVNLHEVDRMGHSMNWDGYLEKAANGAERAVQFWEQLQADPVYADNTVLIVTTDHGRHRDDVDNGFIGHGDSCTGCRQVFLLALGPGIRQGFATDEAISFLDIAPTVAHLVDLPFPFTRGRVITEILVDGDQVDPGPDGAHAPAQAAAGDWRVRAWERQDNGLTDAEGAHQVVVELSTDGGATWQTHDLGGAQTVQLAPIAWTDGEVALVGWQEYEVKGEAWFIRLARFGEESGDWTLVFDEAMAGSGTPMANVLLLDDGEDLHLLESNPRTEVVRTYSSDDRGFSWSDNLQVAPIRRHFQRDASLALADGQWVMTYSAHTGFEESPEDPNENTEIYWQRTDDMGATWTAEAALLDDPAPSIQPTSAVDGDGVLHAVWADMASGVFELYGAGSTDGGQSFTTATPLTVDTGGSWEPALASDGHQVVVAWSRVDGGDGARIHVARVHEDVLVDELAVGVEGVFARTPAVTPLGDCTSWISWSESDLEGDWELQGEVVQTTPLPVSGGTGAVSPAELLVDSLAVELVLTVQLTAGEREQGLDRVEVVLPWPLAPTGDFALEADGEPVQATSSVDGHTLRLDLDALVVDADELVLRMELQTPTELSEPGAVRVTVRHGDDPCPVTVDGEMTVAVVRAAHPPPPEDGDDCSCSDDGGSPVTAAVLFGLVLLAGLRRRDF